MVQLVEYQTNKNSHFYEIVHHNLWTLCMLVKLYMSELEQLDVEDFKKKIYFKQ